MESVSLRCLPPLEVRPSSVAPDPAESRGAPPPPQDPSPLRGTLGQGLVPLRWGCALPSPNAPGKAPNQGLLSRPYSKRRPSPREDGGFSGVSSSCGARGGFLTRQDEDLREPLVRCQPKPPASRALCQAKRAPRAAFPSGCLAAQTKRWAEGSRVPAPLADLNSPTRG